MAGPGGFDPSRLFTALNNTGLQTKDNPLYQVIYQLIGALRDLKVSTSGSSSSSSSVINQITNILGGPAFDGLDGNDGIGFPGPSGRDGIPGIIGPNGRDGIDGLDSLIPGPIGLTGLAGRDGVDGLDGADGLDGISIIGSPGIQGIQGIIGPEGLDGNDGLDGFHLITQPPSGEITITTTGNIDDLDFGGIGLIRMNNASLSTIRGMKSGYSGQLVGIRSVGAGQVNLAHQNTNSVANNRLINTITSGITPLAAGFGTAFYQYDTTTSRWILVSHIQGGKISVAYASGDYTSNAGTWTVDSGDVVEYSFEIFGKDCLVRIGLQVTSTSGAGARLFVLLPNSWTLLGLSQIPTLSQVPTTTVCIMQAYDGASTTQFSFLQLDTTAWPNHTNDLALYGILSIPLN